MTVYRALQSFGSDIVLGYAHSPIVAAELMQSYAHIHSPKPLVGPSHSIDSKTVTTEISQAEWRDASEMNLRHLAISKAAQALVKAVAGVLPDSATLRPKSLQRRQIAIGALLADLLSLHHAGRIGSHSMKREAYPQKVLGFGHTIFDQLKDQMGTAGLLIFQRGTPRWHTIDTSFGQGGGESVIKNTGGYVARFKLTKAMLDLAAAHGVDPADSKDHWKRPSKVNAAASPVSLKDANILLLRTAAKREGARKIDAQPMEVDWTDPRARAILGDIKGLNAFLLDKVDGIDFPGLRRIFSSGDQPAFAWRTGGRFYTVRRNGADKAYEMMSGDERRELIRLDGKPVAEIDMRASQLRLLYALLDTSMPEGLDADPYDLNGLDRDPIKLVVAQALGKSQARSRTWSATARGDYAKANPGRRLSVDYRFKVYEDAVLEAHPLLERLGETGAPTALDLQFVESEIIRSAMQALVRKTIPSLPVHDSLIVPEDAVEDAKVALQEAFKSVVEIEVGRSTFHRPTLSVK